MIWDLIHITSNKKPVLIPNFNLSLIVTIVSDMNTCCLGHLTFGRFPPTRKQFIHVCTVPSGCKKFNTGNRIFGRTGVVNLYGPFSPSFHFLRALLQPLGIPTIVN